ncbi:MAG TPA: protein translocase subunit SecF, partial [Acidimicrobiales bacterium]|nr:protein translocase subunit SecF [Acidimicrobiales bacterium]
GSLGQNATIETLGNGSARTLQVQSQLAGTPGQQAATKASVSARLAKAAHVKPSVVSVSSVGPTWGSQITTKAIEALIVFFICIGLYITVRFEWKMAAAALAAVFHDLLITVGIYALVGFQVSPATVVAVLTILGYSLYDTIVVFDRVKENAQGLGATGRLTYTDTVNLSMNQVLMRSLNTSIVAILPILSILLIGAVLLGATTLQDFGLALVIGLTAGAYSSIFIASPLLALLKEREPRYRAIRRKLEARGEGSMLLTPAAVAAMGRGGGTGRGGTLRPGKRAGDGGDGAAGGSPRSGAGSSRGGTGGSRGTAAGEQSGEGLPLLRPGGGTRSGGSHDQGGRRPSAEVRRAPGGSPPRPRKKGKRR